MNTVGIAWNKPKTWVLELFHIIPNVFNYVLFDMHGFKFGLVQTCSMIRSAEHVPKITHGTLFDMFDVTLYLKDNKSNLFISHTLTQPIHPQHTHTHTHTRTHTQTHMGHAYKSS